MTESPDDPQHRRPAAKSRDTTAAQRAKRYRERRRALTPIVDRDASAVTVATGTAMMPVETVTPTVTTVTDDTSVAPARPPVTAPRALGAVVLALVACGLGACGILINADYGASLARTAHAARLLGALSVFGDALALVLPTTASVLWRDGRHVAAWAAWSTWGLVTVVTMLATVGFASLNIADTTASRSTIADQRVGVAQRVERVRGERATISEVRSVATLEAELQRAQPRVPSDTWGATKRCSDITLPESLQACAAVLALRQALGTARRRDALDLELAEAEAKLSTLPAVTAADPQADTAARLVTWAAAGAIRIVPDDVAMVRILGMVLLPQLAGLVLMFATAVGDATAMTADRADAAIAALRAPRAGGPVAHRAHGALL